ncbi:TRAP transporter, DctM subunit [Pseudonocardia thermophila]|jgi:TRAP-type C4-dicarboxylate transport system, large permease component|uniref:TRAP transporter, DctM subunit n=1 Tax=Pseudonocardia thermophila TaxID=1848 RepID=A0A1M6QH58_PSETH|nr:TRAP transporter large permease subunit [Pseudonocardia thermophila]SHK19536.1 TRAP transporter, DctM subunit [Pseudonocardia thermophila]
MVASQAPAPARTAEPGWIRGVRRATTMAGGLVGVAVVLMALTVLADVIGRSVFNSPLLGTLELVAHLWMPIIALLPLAYAQLHDQHIRVELLLESARARDLRLLLAGAAGIGAAASGWIAWICFGKAETSLAIGETVSGLPWMLLWPGRLAVAVAFALSAIACVAHVVLLLRDQDPAGTLTAATQPGEPGAGRRQVPTALFGGLLAAAILAAALILAGGLPRVAIGVAGVALLLCLLALGLPIGFAMVLTGAIGLAGLSGHRVAETSVGNVVYDAVASWSLSVIPLFVLMGVAVWRGGLTAKAYAAARAWLGRLPGGLAVATNYAGAAMATSSGSTMGVTFALGRMALPEMFRSGYHPRLATGSVAMAGTLGQVIPPSILLVVYAGVASVPVGPQLLAAIVPGALLAVGFSVAIVGWAVLRPQVAPRAAGAAGVTWRERWRTLAGAGPLLLVAALVLGGMLGGIFTATEAAACGAVIALVVGWLGLGREHRSVRGAVRFVRSTVADSVAAVSGLFILIAGSLLMGRFLTLSGAAHAFTSWLLGLQLDRIGLLLTLVVMYVVLGMFLESLPMILLTVPLLQPALEALGVDMVWFGVFLIIMCEIGMVFPPIGIITFVVHRMVQDPELNLGRRVGLGDVFRGVLPFVAAALVVTLVLILWPEIVLWLPRTTE